VLVLDPPAHDVAARLVVNAGSATTEISNNSARVIGSPTCRPRAEVLSLPRPPVFRQSASGLPKPGRQPSASRTSVRVQSRAMDDSQRGSRRDSAPLKRAYPVKASPASGVTRSVPSGAMRAEPGETTRLKREAEELAVLAQVGWVITSSHRIDDVFPRFARAVERLIPWNVVTVSTVNVTGATSKTIYSIGEAVPADTNGSEIPVSGHLLLDVATSRRGMILDGLDRDAILTRYPGMAGIPGLGFDSWLCVPLIWRDECIAVLTLRARGAGVYSNRQLALAERVGMQIAGAVAHAGLLAEVRAKAYETSVIAELSRVLGSSLNMVDVLPGFSEHLNRLLPFDRVDIVTIEQDRAITTRWSFAPKGGTGKVTVAIDALRGGPTEEVLAVRVPIVRRTAHPGTWDGAGSLSDAPYEVFGSLLAVPLTVRDEVLGSLVCCSLDQESYGLTQQDAAVRVSGQISGIIGNLRLHRELEGQSAERELLADLARLTRPGIAFPDLCERVAERIRAILNFDRFVVTWTDPDRGVVTVLYMSSRDADGSGRNERYQLQGSVAAEVSRAGRGLILDAHANDYEVLQPLEHKVRLLKGYMSLLAVPIPLLDEPNASLQIYSKRIRAYGARELDLAERIGNELGKALSLARARALLVADPSVRPSFTYSPIEARDLAWLSVSGEGPDEPRSHGAARISLILIDRQPICRRGLEALFRSSPIQVEAQAATLEAAPDLVRRYRPHVVLYEIHDGDSVELGGLRAAAVGEDPPKVLILAERADLGVVKDSLANGASGFLLKSVSPVGLVNAVHRVAHGGVVIEPELLAALLPSLVLPPAGLSEKDRDIALKLGDRERRLLRALRRGLANQAIASELCLSEGSVRNALTRLYRTIGVSGRGGATSFAMRTGI